MRFTAHGSSLMLFNNSKVVLLVFYIFYGWKFREIRVAKIPKETEVVKRVAQSKDRCTNNIKSQRNRGPCMRD